MKPQKGDIVHIKATVVTVGDYGVDNILVEATCSVRGWVRPDQILKIEERPLAVGDRVAYIAAGTPWTILAIKDDYAWLQRCGADEFRTTYVKGLERLS